jgi:hypothetical protein
MEGMDETHLVNCTDCYCINSSLETITYPINKSTMTEKNRFLTNKQNENEN